MKTIAEMKFENMDMVRAHIELCEKVVTELQNRSANFHEEVGCTCEDEHSTECDMAQHALFTKLDAQEAIYQQQIDALEPLLLLADAHGADWLLNAALDYQSGNVDDALQCFQYGDPCTYEDAADYARQTCEGMGDVPSFYENYIDYERLGTDMLMDVSYSEFGGMICVWE